MAPDGAVAPDGDAPPNTRARRSRRRRHLYAALGIAALALWLTGCMERLFYVPTREPTPAPTWLSPGAEEVRFESSDGTRLCGWFVPALDRPARDAATIVHVHGNAGSMVSHLGFVDHLPAAGFNVFLFDYRGYGESEGSATGRAALVEDAKAALRTVRARPDVDPDRIALLGQSLGGAVAVIVMADDLAHGGRIRSAVLESPFASWREVAAAVVGGDPPPAWARGLAAWLIKDEVAGASRPVDAIATIDRPILVLHGTADRIVPVSQGRRLAAAGRNVELVEFANGDHNTLQLTHPLARQRMIEFLTETTAP
ncbi:MAG: alpha/beta fold hydrolase [Phycisphaerales bacterium]|nr:alpha/beta fold hydrolase [Phycisphaerales bacterium]